MQSKANQKITSIQMKIHPMLQTVQQQCIRRSRRTRRAPQHFGDNVTGRELENLELHCDALISRGLPSNTADAPADPNWKATMDREFKSLEENGVWELVKPTSGQGIISGKRNFAHKLDDEGNVVKYKAQFVARGFTQTPSLGSHDTHSPTAKLSTLRTVLACGVKLGMHFSQMDMKTAYLNAPIQKDIYLEQPEGYQKGKQMVCKLKRSLYGLKQSGHNWFECLSSHMFELNFEASVHDSCLLTLTRRGHKCWIVIWVDDILYESTDSQFTTWFNDKMSERFNIGKSGPLTWFLRISFKWVTIR